MSNVTAVVPIQNTLSKHWQDVKNSILAINQWIEWAITRSIREGLVPKSTILFDVFVILLLIDKHNVNEFTASLQCILWISDD